MVNLLRHCACHVCHIVLLYSALHALTTRPHALARRIDDEVEGGGGRRAYTNGWAIRIKTPDDLDSAVRIAKKHGFEKVTKIGDLDGYYHLEHPTHPKRSRRSAEEKTDLLQQEPEVDWVEQQHEYVREKRGLHHQQIVTRGIEPRFADPLWDEQWYLDDKRTQMDLDVNVIPVWNAGISGKGVVVTILDDGIEHNHTDLLRNYDAAASWDVNDNDPDPFPRYDPTNENKHGTRCAGEVAAQANNTKCGVGIAYNAKIGGVRMLDGRVTDRVEAESLSLNPQYIDIYSASWGPSDDGMTVEGPGTLASAAFLNGITKGRNGLGSIYLWASGNGGRHDDSCNCDGYTASIYTLSISSSSDHGESPWYSEACASTLATTLSSGAHGEKRIVTTDLHNLCTERHTGTSASAPLAAGIIALALEKNPKLTWRDVNHLVVHSANWSPLKRDQDWRMNGIGLHVNEKFGFGLLDSERLVALADPIRFRTVPPKVECQGKIFSNVKNLRWDQPLALEIPSDGCKGTPNEIRYLEHIQVVLTIEYSRRGDLVIFMVTPMGTRTCLLPVRSEDSSDEGFKRWAFMSTHAWGEDPRGTWTLEIKDGGESRSNTGALKDWQLVIHGTKTKPYHQNITHPDVPTHRKAVPDDVKSSAKSSVQITQITYTFGDQHPPSSSQTIVPTNDQLNLFNPPVYSPSVVVNPNPQPLGVSSYGSPPVATSSALINAEYSFNPAANLNPYLRTNIPYPSSSFQPNSYINLFNSQSLLNPQAMYQGNLNNNNNNQGLVGRSVPWPNNQKSPALQYFSNNPGNLWNFFGRFSGKRRSVVSRRRRNSLVRLIEKLRRDTAIRTK